MVSRKSHPKSRNGCSQCKRRRIKCDEVAPRCNNCTKHDIECEFSLDPSKAPTTPTTLSRKRSSASQSPESRSDGYQPTKTFSAAKNVKVHATGLHLPPLQMEELELLHHFTTQTCFTLSDRPESHALWQLIVPQEAFKHDFLMRGILAITALHLIYLGHEKAEYWQKYAIQQQDAALSAFRSLMAKMDESYCDAFFALSSLVVVYGFEFPKTADSLGPFDFHEDQSDEWLPLIRGVNSIISSLWPYIKAGKLSGLLHDHPREQPQNQMPEVLIQQLENLNRLCEASSSGEDAVAVYKITVDALWDCFVRINNKLPYECEVSIAFLWPVMIPQEFITRLNAREPEALIILAHYCVILHHLDGYWWMSGWAMHIVRNIYRQLEGSKRDWLEWPINVVGLTEPMLANGTLQNPIQDNLIRSDLESKLEDALRIPEQHLDEMKDASTSPTTIKSNET